MSVVSCNVHSSVIIAGCPHRGFASLDFRREAGLPDGMDNLMPISGQITDEQVIRQLVSAGCLLSVYADSTARVSLSDGNGWPIVCTAGGTTTSHGGSYGWRATVDVATLRTGDIGAIALAVARDTPQRAAQLAAAQARFDAAAAEAAAAETELLRLRG